MNHWVFDNIFYDIRTANLTRIYVCLYLVYQKVHGYRKKDRYTGSSRII